MLVPERATGLPVTLALVWEVFACHALTPWLGPEVVVPHDESGGVRGLLGAPPLPLATTPHTVTATAAT